jgi:sugar transferase (PEP-CTERM/EpsH1 system associated)
VHILWLKTELLHPVDKGGRIRTYNMLRALRREHRVTYLTLDDGTAAPDAVERATEEYCHDLVRVPFATAPKRSARFFAELAANVLSPLPYAVAKYRSTAMRAAVERAARSGDVDVVVCDFLFPSVNVPDRLGVPTVLFQHNVEAMIWERHADVAAGRLKRRYMREQWRRMRRHEADECRRFDHVVAVSPQDAAAFARDYGVDASDVPTGVDTEYFRPSGREAPRPNNLVFTGSMDWMPNEDAVLWFASEILPRVRARVPDATLTVVGRHPPPRVRALADAGRGVEVTGSVPDVRPYMERAAAFVVPIRVGGGTRLKVYEAMAMEKPLISTPVGAEGLPLRDGVDAILAEEPGAFADAVVSVLGDPGRARSLAASGAELVRARYGWDRVAAQFAAACEATAAGRRPSRSAPELGTAGVGA